ncbi:hypothetical protein OSTOST_25299, partial [Ostertagia ostertagi]
PTPPTRDRNSALKISTISSEHNQHKNRCTARLLFTLLEDEIGQQQTLPSGLRVIPSKLGHLVIGRTGVLNDESPTNAVTVSDESTLPQVSTARDKEEESLTIYVLTDSEIALNWIARANDDAAAGVFVNNRSKEIHQIVQQVPVPVRFGHVPTSVNPADCATRGLNKDELKQHFWWNGPDFLSLPPDKWETVVRFFPMPDKTEEESNNENCVVNLSTSAIASVSDLLDWKRHSSWQSCQTTMAYALRFIKAIVSRVDADLRSRIANHAPDIMKMSGEP